MGQVALDGRPGGERQVQDLPDCLELGAEGGTGQLVLILEAGTITMLCWWVLQGAQCLQRVHQVSPTWSTATASTPTPFAPLAVMHCTHPRRMDLLGTCAGFSPERRLLVFAGQT